MDNKEANPSRQQTWRGRSKAAEAAERDSARQKRRQSIKKVCRANGEKAPGGEKCQASSETYHAR